MVTVKVQFPDGEREVPAHWADCYMGGNARTPDPIDGWSFRRTLGGWIAFSEHGAPTPADHRTTVGATAGSGGV